MAAARVLVTGHHSLRDLALDIASYGWARPSAAERVGGPAGTIDLMAALHTLSFGTQGSPVVFLHGLFGQGRNWTTIGKALADRHRVLLVDLPDHGRSPWTESVDYVGYADQVAALLSDVVAEAGESVTLVGHSMGGKVAMVLALLRPELVARLVVADMSPVAYSSAREFRGYVEALQALDLSAIATREDADTALAPAVPSPSVRAFLLQNLRRNLDPDDGSGAWQWQMNLAVLGRDVDTLSSWPADRLGDAVYDGPVLWIAGELSGYIKEEYAATMLAYFPRARKVTIKGASHWVHSDAPEVFTQVLRQFLGD